MRPIVHTFGSFLVERAFEQVKLGFGHQDVGGVLVGSGGSFDIASGGRTHQVPGDVALMDTLPDVHIHAPSTSTEVDAILRTTVAGDGLHYVRVVGQTNATLAPAAGLHVVRRGAGATVVALGPVLDDVLAADRGAGRDGALRQHRAALRRGVACARCSAAPDVVLVEPWLAGTSAHVVADALRDVPHRLLALGVGRDELRRYGTPADHIAAHGLDAAGIRRSLDGFLARRGLTRAARSAGARLANYDVAAPAVSSRPVAPV